MSARASVDPRIWNLAAASVMAAASGCGPGRGQLIVNDEPETETTATPTTNPDDDAETSGCQSSADCPPAYYCFEGECRYEGYTDGHWPEYDCYDDAECGDYEVCDFGYCVDVDGARVDACRASLLPIPEILDVGHPDNIGQVLALHFVELDGDGKDELVAVRFDGLRVYDVDAEAVSVSESEVGGDYVASATGQLDGSPGEDLLVVTEADRQLYSSNGDGTFAVPGHTPKLVLVPEGVRVADFDGLGALDQLVHGEYGARLELADGQLVNVLDVNASVDRAAVHDRAQQMFGGYALASASQIWFFDFDHVQQASPGASLAGPLAAVTAADAPYFVGFDWVGSWSTLRVWDASGTAQYDYQHAGQVRHFAVAELDADGAPEWVLGTYNQLSIWRQPLSPEECLDPWPVSEFALIRSITVGDYDGDGDDEVALATILDEIVLLSS